MPTESSAALVDRIFSDPPPVHPGAPGDIWNTERDAYILLADLIDENTRSIETGCGISTAVFAGRRAQHLCLTLVQSEADTFTSWCDRHGTRSETVSFVIGPSELTLPRLDLGHIDVAFIDGNHGHPLPVIDWYYTVTHFAVGGVVFVDDVQLPAPRLVADYMEAIGSWSCLRRTAKWAAYRLSDKPPPEEWEPLTAGSSLFGANGRFERLGRRADRLVDRVRHR
jgi:hypothetical protein